MFKSAISGDKNDTFLSRLHDEMKKNWKRKKVPKNIKFVILKRASFFIDHHHHHVLCTNRHKAVDGACHGERSSLCPSEQKGNTPDNLSGGARESSAQQHYASTNFPTSIDDHQGGWRDRILGAKASLEATFGKTTLPWSLDARYPKQSQWDGTTTVHRQHVDLLFLWQMWQRTFFLIDDKTIVLKTCIKNYHSFRTMNWMNGPVNSNAIIITKRPTRYLFYYSPLFLNSPKGWSCENRTITICLSKRGSNSRFYVNLSETHSKKNRKTFFQLEVDIRVKEWSATMQRNWTKKQFSNFILAIFIL